MNRRDFLRIAGAGATLSWVPVGCASVGTDVFAKRSKGADPLKRSTPEAQGIASSALLAFVEEAEDKLDALHSLMVARNGHIVAEGWWTPYAPELNHWLFSLSKGFTSTGVGIAIAEGQLSLDDKVISFFPEEAPESPSDNLKAMTVRDLLKMTHGHHGNADRVTMRSDDWNWTRNWLAFEVDHDPGTHWTYSNSGAYMLSAIVQKVTGERLVDYMQPRFFEPLGIANSFWDVSPEGVSLGGSGLRVTTEDILRYGQFYLQRGSWEGSQILPESWVAEATSLQATTPPSDPIAGWGYNFIIYPEQGAFGSGGAFGQNCFILPKSNSVVAITAGVRKGGQMQAVTDLVWKYLLPAMGESPLPRDDANATELSEKLRGLSLPVPEGRAESPRAPAISNRTFLFPENDRGLKAIELKSNSDGAVLSLTNADGAHRIMCGHGTWKRGRTGFEPPSLVNLGIPHDGSVVHCAARGAWTSDDVFAARLCYTESPIIEDLTLKFEGNQVTLDQQANLSLVHWNAKPRPQLAGTAS
jgi:CubicO group peptidase (beta-lactamase class C family)